LDSGIERYFVTSTHDDQRGITQTYTYFSQSSPIIQPLASSGIFIIVVAALVAGTLAGLVANAADGSGAVIAIASAIVGASYFAVCMSHFTRRFMRWQREYEALFPHPAAPVAGARSATPD
jgi:uncharacterized membrane protein YeaQ/YmgE (transglycosylase-associated protein family)